MEKVKKLSLVFLTIMFFTLNVNAELLAPATSSPPLIAINASYDCSVTSQITYPIDANASILVNTTDRVRAYSMIHLSSLLPNAVYKITINIGDPLSEILYGETGYLKITDDIYAGYVDLSKILPHLDTSVSKYGNTQHKITYFNEVKKFTLDNYRMFYDKTAKELSIIWYNQDIQYDTYLFIAYGTNTTEYGLNFGIKEPPTLLTKDIYTDQLNDILSKLDNISGSGITNENIDQAIQDALTAHDELLEHEVGGKLDQIMEQINGIVSPYKDAADDINTAFDGLSDVFASSSTASVFKFPEGRMPNGVVLWQEYNIDIGAAWNQLPAKFRSVVQIVCTFTILYIVIQEAVFVIKFIILGRKGSADD